MRNRRAFVDCSLCLPAFRPVLCVAGCRFRSRPNEESVHPTDIAGGSEDSSDLIITLSVYRRILSAWPFRENLQQSVEEDFQGQALLDDGNRDIDGNLDRSCRCSRAAPRKNSE
jgi:hypothetical protein